MTHESRIDNWIRSRREVPTADLTGQVLEAIHEQPPEPELRPTRVFAIPRPLVAAACLVAGVGKIAVILQTAF